jgi:hypothetical protein|tara:strand:+ start:50 stop:292 length:243 start_codon:yes stop_codon:yes gene_type:complete
MSIENPTVRKVFDDLDKFRDYCRFEAKPFNEKALYNNEDPVWIAYNKWQGWMRAKARSAKEGKPFVNRPRKDRPHQKREY